MPFAVDRNAFYVLAFVTSALQMIFGFIAGFINGESPLLHIFGKIAGALAIATVTWISVLMKNNRRPEGKNLLTRAYTHFGSFATFSVVWLAIGIMLATQTPPECAARTLWCAAAAFSATLAFLTSLFSGTAAVLIYLLATVTGAGLSVNIAECDSRRLYEGV